MNQADKLLREIVDNVIEMDDDFNFRINLAEQDILMDAFKYVRSLDNDQGYVIDMVKVEQAILGELEECDDIVE